jgi:hypothetical protein
MGHPQLAHAPIPNLTTYKRQPPLRITAPSYHLMCAVVGQTWSPAPLGSPPPRRPLWISSSPVPPKSNPEPPPLDLLLPGAPEAEPRAAIGSLPPWCRRPSLFLFCHRHRRL